MVHTRKQDVLLSWLLQTGPVSRIWGANKKRTQNVKEKFQMFCDPIIETVAEQFA